MIKYQKDHSKEFEVDGIFGVNGEIEKSPHEYIVSEMKMLSESGLNKDVNT